MSVYELGSELTLEARGFGENSTISFLKSGQSQFVLSGDEWQILLKNLSDLNEEVLKRRNSPAPVLDGEDAILGSIINIRSVLDLVLNKATRDILLQKFNELTMHALDSKFSAVRLGPNKRLRIKYHAGATRLILYSFNAQMLPISQLEMNFGQWNELGRNISNINRDINREVIEELDDQQ